MRSALRTGTLGVLDGALGVLDGALGVLDGALGVLDGALGVLDGALGVTLRRRYGRGRRDAGRAGVFSGMTFSVLFSSARIAFASAFNGFVSGATSTKCCR